MSLEKAIFAGGCFWCMVKPFDTWDGVHSVISGYTNGHVENPTYEQVKAGNTGHYEAVEITFDNTRIDYNFILDLYWQQIDPTNSSGQFKDAGAGSQYEAAIFYTNPKQKEIAENSKQALAASGKFNDPIVTKILPAKRFYQAEEYHQDYYKKNKAAYEKFREDSNRDSFLKAQWGNESDNKTSTN